MLSLQASLVNGWNDDPDFNAHKTVGFVGDHHAGPIATIVATTYIGKEAARRAMAMPSTPGDTRILVDLVAALTFSDKLGLNLNFDYVKVPEQRVGYYLVGVAGDGPLRDQRPPERRGPRRVRRALATDVGVER